MRSHITFYSILFFAATALLGCNGKDSDSLGPQSGVGGSMARFAITGNTLYIVSHQTLEVYNIAEGGNPVKGGSKDMNVGIETIFPYNDRLFIGATDGMYIYDNKTPGAPEFLTKYTHVQSCDPVVVQGNYAYVTLRGGSQCRNGQAPSSLDVVDISDPFLPSMVNTQFLRSPYGLGVSGNKLFVCDGENGFRVMDLTDPRNPNQIHYYSSIPSYDVIARDNNLIITGKNGLFQYKYDDSDQMEFLSKIPVL